MQQFHPHPYQQAAIDAILAKPGVALWMEMGLGKTVVTLTAIDQLLYDRLEVSRESQLRPSVCTSHGMFSRLMMYTSAGVASAASRCLAVPSTVEIRREYFWPTEYSYEPRAGAAEAVERQS